MYFLLWSCFHRLMLVSIPLPLFFRLCSIGICPLPSYKGRNKSSIMISMKIFYLKFTWLYLWMLYNKMRFAQDHSSNPWKIILSPWAHEIPMLRCMPKITMIWKASQKESKRVKNDVGVKIHVRGVWCNSARDNACVEASLMRADLRVSK